MEIGSLNGIFHNSPDLILLFVNILREIAESFTAF
jgi:hypothetical protein